MSYVYFPGCSLKGLGKAYDESLLAVFEKLSIAMPEIEDWNCCGATSYNAMDEMKAFGLSARNLAIAEKQGNGDGQVDIIAPCASCYMVLNKTQHYLKEYPKIGGKVHEAMKSAGLSYQGNVNVKHPLEVLVNDLGLDKVAAQVKKPLKGLKVACYYGCQIVRPYSTFDDQNNPMFMDKLMKSLGAEVIDWPLKARCCGGSLTGTVQEVGVRLSYIILKEARKRGADVIATACPLCQFNLECYQDKMRSWYKDSVDMPVAYFTQIMGLAFGLDNKKLAMQRLFVSPDKVIASKVKEGGSYVNS
jgi:heterodisulfide reductase subunit B2